MEQLGVGAWPFTEPLAGTVTLAEGTAPSSVRSYTTSSWDRRPRSGCVSGGYQFPSLACHQPAAGGPDGTSVVAIVA